MYVWVLSWALLRAGARLAYASESLGSCFPGTELLWFLHSGSSTFQNLHDNIEN